MNNDVIELKLNLHDKEIAELKEEVKEISKITTSIVVLTDKIDSLNKNVEKLNTYIDKEKAKPSKLQDKIQTGIIYTIVIAGVGFALKQIFGW